MTSATDEAWWPEFLQAYGDTPLRELARRFGTNPRRLRRAAQRCGLADEPQVLRDNAGLLGTLPDLSLADRLGVTPEAVKGARGRRNIPAFSPKALPRVRTPRPVKEEVPVVVRRAPSRPPSTDKPAGFRKMSGGPVVVERTRRSLSSSWDEELPPARDVRNEGKRRRVVPRAEREPIEPPEQQVQPRRRQPRKDYAPVKTLFDRKDDDDVPPGLAVQLPVRSAPAPLVARDGSPKPLVQRDSSPKPVVQRDSSPKPVVARDKSPKPLVQRDSSPKPLVQRDSGPKPLVPRDSAPKLPAAPPVEAAPRFWTAVVDGQERVVQAATLAEAAARASREGEVSRLEPVDAL